MNQDFQILSSLQSQLTSADAVESATEIAELAKDGKTKVLSIEQWREKIGNSDLITLIAQIIEPSESQLTVQLLRCIGNLTYENGIQCSLNDVGFNRDMIAETDGAVGRIFGCIEFHVNLTFSVLLNLTMENKTTQEMIVDMGGIPKILSKIFHSSKGQDLNCIITGIRLIANILEIDKGPTEFVTAGGILTLKDIIRNYLQTILGLSKSETEDRSGALTENFDAIDACGMLLETIIEDDATQREIIDSGFLFDLFWIIEELYKMMVVVDSSSSDEDFIFSHDIQTMVADLLKSYCALVTVLSANDFYMKHLVSNIDIVNTFKKWVQTDNITHKPQLELAVTGALCLGNLARSDETCFQLVQQYEVDKILISSLHKHVQKINGDHHLSSENLVQAIISALKNITLADSCKELIDSSFLFQSIMELLKHPKGRQVTCNSISITKNLTTGKSDFRNIYRLVLSCESYDDENVNDASSLTFDGSASLIERINTLAWCSTDESDSNIRNETGRVNANLVKLIHKNNVPNLGKLLIKYGCVTLLVQVVTGYILSIPFPREMSPKDLSDEKYVDLNPSRTFQTFSVVQNEGIVALVLLCSICEEALNVLARYHIPLFAFLGSILLRTNSGEPTIKSESSTLDSVTTLNASHLLLILCQASVEFRNIANDHFGDVITSINKTAQNQPKIIDTAEEMDEKSHLPFPTESLSLRLNGRKLHYHDAIRYRQELEINVDQQGGLRRALHLENSTESLEEVTGSLIDIFNQGSKQ